ncbi:NAD(P)/FAD-dependent oxidoreductase [Sinisalibacter aestuarii]|uniref:Oxidoreductase n=1 Tax=Sinisalibacter aestuarii TaxID=2949426 RepID=A0ABQ5LRR6_9RHOB|nr:FAD-dependent oxidoreductase [Sinisalibacter aestuarii]GKY86936.1 oxidoreductase [Sinisalibacter aestuarii]
MVDVTVRGAGAFGLAVAYACAIKGAKVRVVDPAGPGAGASGGLVGALAPHVPEMWNEKKAFQFASLAMAEEFWAEVAATGGVDPGYARTGRLQPIADDRALDLARARAQTAAELWQGRFVWEIVEATGDWAPVSPTGLLIHDTLTARAAPCRAVAALKAAIEARGGVIASDAPDEGRVVWATGAAGLVELSGIFGKSVGVPVKGQSAALAHDARHLPQLFAGGVHIVPHADGTVAIGSTTERDYDDPSGCDAQLDDVIAAARAACPALADAPVIDRWAGLRPRSKTRAPMLGRWPGRAGHYIANGGFKIGFGMAPKVGLVMADLVLDGEDAIPAAFRVEANL